MLFKEGEIVHLKDDDLIREMAIKAPINTPGLIERLKIIETIPVEEKYLVGLIKDDEIFWMQTMLASGIEEMYYSQRVNRDESLGKLNL